MKLVLVALVVAVVAGAIAGEAVLSRMSAEEGGEDDICIVGVVKPPTVNITPVTISVGALDPLQEYHITSYEREVITTNCKCNVSIHLNTATLSQDEIDVLGDPLLTIFIFNASDASLIYEANANLSTWASPFNYTMICPLEKGAYDVSVALDGKTAVPENETTIDFSVVIERV
ncbi:hypothetical protein DRN52_07705 [Thermococci archaeon]|nr:MAG: hypothetical protein DRN52_07705 [Thermococci archaeon]